eukprot:gene19263-biopygen43464
MAGPPRTAPYGASLRRPRAAPLAPDPPPPAQDPALPAPGYGLAVDIAMLPGHQAGTAGRKHRFRCHDPERWIQAGATRVRDAGGGLVVVFGELAQPFPKASVFRGVHPAFEHRLSQAAALHARGSLSLLHPPPTGAFTAWGGWRDPLLFARYYAANLDQSGAVGRRLPVGAVLAALRRALREGAAPPSPPAAAPADAASLVLAKDDSYVTWTCDGPFPRLRNLARNREAWELLGAPRWLLHYIDQGYRPHYHARVAPVWCENAADAIREAPWVDTALRALEQA